MARHITEFKIQSYRGIKDLELKGLNHINILTGDNNSGKTSVLELIQSIDNPKEFSSWYHMLRRNEEISVYNQLINLFPVNDDEKTIKYSYQKACGEKMQVSLQAEEEYTQILEKEKLRLSGYIKTGSPKKDEIERMTDVKCLHLSLALNGIETEQFSIYDFQTKFPLFSSKDDVEIPTLYISPTDHIRGFALKEVLNNSEMYESMIELLKEFDPNIINITTVDEYVGQYMILSKNHKKALPLNVYGDGMKKAIMIVAAIVYSKNGILLMDEFETAIHTSAMDRVFEWILTSAKKMNIQIFLSSHSEEAIKKVLNCKEEFKKDINLYTLYNVDDKNLVRCLNGEEAIYADEQLGLELR